MKVLVYGSGDFGRVVSALAIACGYEFSGYIDDLFTSDSVVGTYAQCRISHPPSQHAIAIAVGYRWMSKRELLLQKIQADGYVTPPLIHPKAYVTDTAHIGAATIVMMSAVIDVLAVVNNLCVIWPGAIINHEAQLEQNIFVGPNTTVCGKCKIGSNSFLGAGATIVDHVQVPQHTFVKAGAVFTHTSVPTIFQEDRNW